MTSLNASKHATTPAPASSATRRNREKTGSSHTSRPSAGPRQPPTRLSPHAPRRGSAPLPDPRQQAGPRTQPAPPGCQAALPARPPAAPTAPRPRAPCPARPAAAADTSAGRPAPPPTPAGGAAPARPARPHLPPPVLQAEERGGTELPAASGDPLPDPRGGRPQPRAQRGGGGGGRAGRKARGETSRNGRVRLPSP